MPAFFCKFYYFSFVAVRFNEHVLFVICFYNRPTIVPNTSVQCSLWLRTHQSMILCAHQCSNPFVSFFFIEKYEEITVNFSLSTYLAQSETGLNVVVIFLLKRCENDESFSVHLCACGCTDFPINCSILRKHFQA